MGRKKVSREKTDTRTHYPRHVFKLLAYKGCFLTVLPIFSGRVAGLVAFWFELGRVAVPMLVKSALKAVHGGCINNVIWEFPVPGPDSASASGAGGRGFVTWPHHTKGVKDGTSGNLA